MILNVKSNMFYPKRRNVRRYYEECIKLGFIEYASDVTKRQSLVCCKTLSNKSMTPAKLKRYLMIQHSESTENTRKKERIFEAEKLLQNLWCQTKN